MSPHVLAHIFEPFFTTKPVGEGTGLGLSTVYGIVKQSSGYIWASSEPGRGTAFCVNLPSTRASNPVVTTGNPSAPAGRHETVLIVDDEPGVRAVMGRALSGAGFVVLEAADACEAIDLLQQQAEPPSAVITDMVMEGMNGRELVRRITDDLPGVPVLLMSGSTDDDIAHLGSQDRSHRFLQKPFSAVDLVQAVRTLIDDYPTRRKEL
jgi:CheY-like chemotaxis protein